MAVERAEIDLPIGMWRIIRDCVASGLYGDGVSDTIAALLRPGLEGAIRIGVSRMSAQTAALHEARSMLKSCGLDEDADDDLKASWARGLAKIDAALGNS